MEEGGETKMTEKEVTNKDLMESITLVKALIESNTIGSFHQRQVPALKRQSEALAYIRGVKTVEGIAINHQCLKVLDRIEDILLGRD